MDSHAWSEIIGAVAALLVAFTGIAVWMDRRAGLRHKSGLRIVETTLQAMARRFALAIKDAADEDPHGCLTLDFSTPDGHRMRIAIPKYRKLEVWDGVWMVQRMSHGKDCSNLLLEAPSIATLPSHLHWESVERATVRSGTMKDLESGRVYAAGETWEIPCGTVHSVLFDHAEIELCIKPPLPTAAESPPDVLRAEEFIRFVP